MRMLGLAATALICMAGPTVVTAQSDGSPMDMQDMVESMGVKLPKGEELGRLVAEAEQYPLGSERNPVRVDPAGGLGKYLRRLRCPNGKRPDHRRVFSAGIGPFGRIIDEYKLTCGERAESVYVDLYHRGHVETRPVPGYSMSR